MSDTRWRPVSGTLQDVRGTGVRALIFAATALIGGCGSADGQPLNTGQVEREVARQTFASLNQSDRKGDRIAANCARVEDAERTFRCRVVIKLPVGEALGGGYITMKPQNVTAIVSDDGKNVVVEGL